MNIQQISEQQGMVQNFGFRNTNEFGYNMFPQCFQESPSVRDEEERRQQQNFWSDTTMISHIGSPSTAFFATERCMGLAQYDSIQKHPNFDMHMHIQEQQTPGNAFFPDSSSPPPPLPLPLPTTNVPTPSSSSRSTYSNPFSNLSEKERILHLKNKLLGEYDNAVMRRHLPSSSSLPFNGNQDAGVSLT